MLHCVSPWQVLTSVCALLHKQKQKHHEFSTKSVWLLLPASLSHQVLLSLATSACVITVWDFWFRGEQHSSVIGGGKKKKKNPEQITYTAVLRRLTDSEIRPRAKITCDAWAVCRNMLFCLLVQIGGGGSIQIIYLGAVKILHCKSKTCIQKLK